MKSTKGLGTSLLFTLILSACGGGSSGSDASSNETPDKPINSIPQASDVHVSLIEAESKRVGDTLTASYAYTDTDNDLEGISKFQWVKDGHRIEGATFNSYTLTDGDVPAQIHVEITPIAQTGNTEGNTSISPALFTGGNYYYVDPINGDDSQDGSKQTPWKSLQHLFDDNKIASQQWDALPYSVDASLVPRNEKAQVQGGDVIWLKDGHYGNLMIDGYYNTHTLYLVAAPEQRPEFSQLRIRASSHWSVSGVVVKANLEEEVTGLVLLESHSYRGPISNITVQNSQLLSIEDSSLWDASDWIAYARSGFKVAGTEMTIKNNQLLNVRFGMDISATHSQIENNRVTNFSGDGMRSIGANYSVFQGNTIENCYDVDENHDDGFQNFAVGPDGTVATGVTTGVVIRGNIIRNFTDPENPLRGPLQGIASFDGTIDNWLVEDNQVIVDNWHGISLYGALNTQVRNNIIMDPDGPESVGPGAIRIYPSKTDIPSANVLVECNITPNISIPEGQGQITTRYNTLTNEGLPWDPNCSAE